MNTNQQNLNDSERGGKSSGDEVGPDQKSERQVDENLVTWNTPNDPANPKNWTMKKKWTALICVSLFALISPLTSTMVAPALPSIGESLHIASSLELALTLSIFVAAYAVGPLFWGPISELRGRVFVLQTSNLCRPWGSAPLAVGGGVISDMFEPEERGRAISVYSVAPLLGPALGPIAGGWVAERTTWRWVFYSTTIACGFVQVAALLFLKETYAPVILEQKKQNLVKESGNMDLYTEHDQPDRTLARTLGIALARPFRLLFTQPIVIFLAAYMTYLYGTMYLVLSTFSGLFEKVHHETPGYQGLNYISLAIGLFIGTYICARSQDRIYKALKRRRWKEGQPGRPEFRIPMMIPGAILVPTGLLIYSWTAEKRTHWMGPNVGACVYTTGVIIGFQCIQGYLVDSYTRYAASAVAAATVTRSLARFGFPLFAADMYDTLGYGWGGTLLAGLAVVLG
ncbi:multidrug resistance [Fusarium circinatum]|uniref:Multidrug resistance n=1 Tax=Fusarium circinatum TaxID=48490 RepID=A0A8H6CSP1_FUSCI|nr:multidrug resistance [Fusarium circinatum]